MSAEEDFWDEYNRHLCKIQDHLDGQGVLLTLAQIDHVICKAKDHKYGQMQLARSLSNKSYLKWLVQKIQQG